MSLSRELDPPPCLACGTCCFTDQPRAIRVTGDDHERLGDDAERVTHFLGNQCFMQLRDGHCAALTVDAREGHFVCSVYERRPRVCRDLERGGPACRAELHEKPDRPEVLLAALRARR